MIALKHNGTTYLTMRLTSRTKMKVGHNDLGVPCGSALTQHMKGTMWIISQWFPRALIDKVVWHLNVDSSHLKVEEGPKGLIVCWWKWYVSWV